MVRRGVHAPQCGAGVAPKSNAFVESLRRNNIRPFPTESDFILNEGTNMNTNTNTAEKINDAVNQASHKEVEERAEQLRETADQLEEDLNRARQENDQADTGPSHMASKVRQKSTLRTVRRVLGWSLGVGVVACGAAYAISRLRQVGVEVSDEVVEAVENAGEQIADAIAG